MPNNHAKWGRRHACNHFVNDGQSDLCNRCGAPFEFHQGGEPYMGEYPIPTDDDYPFDDCPFDDENEYE